MHLHPIVVHNHLSRDLPFLLKFMKKPGKTFFLTVSPDCLCSSVYFTLTGFLSKDFVTEVKVVTYFIHEAYCQTSGKLSNSELWKYRFNKNIALARLG